MTQVKTASFGSVLALSLILPLAACASEGPNSSVTSAQSAQVAPGEGRENTHARTFDYAYTMSPTMIEGVTIIVKHLEDGSRWGLLDGSWYDLDQSEGIATQIAEQGLVPPNRSILEKKPANSKARKQYDIDLEYYKRSKALRSS